MSAPFVDLIAMERWGVPLAVLFASLAGSAHCVSMCGGLVVSVAGTPAGRIRYHLGRLLGYLSLGAIAGSLGEFALQSSSSTSVWLHLASWAAALLVGLSFFFLSVALWFGKTPHVSLLPKAWVFELHQFSRPSPFLTGLFSAFLPCGWLHGFVIGALATRSSIQGAGFLGMFWLGTLPALTSAPWLVEQIFRPLSKRAPRFAATLLLAAGITTLGVKIRPMLNEAPPHEGSAELTCH